MAWVTGGKHFGQWTYEHWFDDEYNESKLQIATEFPAHNATKFPAHEASGVKDETSDQVPETDSNNADIDKQPQQP